MLRQLSRSLKPPVINNLIRRYGSHGPTKSPSDPSHQKSLDNYQLAKILERLDKLEANSPKPVSEADERKSAMFFIGTMATILALLASSRP